MTDDHWILTLYHRYVELYGDPAAPSEPFASDQRIDARGEALHATGRQSP
jgi:hypothetical protein